MSASEIFRYFRDRVFWMATDCFSFITQKSPTETVAFIQAAESQFVHHSHSYMPITGLTPTQPWRLGKVDPAGIYDGRSPAPPFR
jgi:hypothetical protein